MTLTWTFYPKYEGQSITLTVVYIPSLDNKKLEGGGYLIINTNTAYVDWTTYKRFDSADVENRKDAFNHLIAIDQEEDFFDQNRPEFPLLK
ncbi:hypothetical protein [Spirosoma aerophilum]